MKLKRTILLGFALLASSVALAQTVLPPFISGTDTKFNRSIFEVGVLRIARNTALTATAGGTLANSQVLNLGLNRFTVVATAAASATLPTVSGGVMVVVVNADSADSMRVFPNSATSTINAGAGGAAFAVAAGKTAIFFQANDGNWYAVLSA